MEPNRKKYRVESGLTAGRSSLPSLRSRQAGVTAIGLLILASVFGVLGLGGMKITPLYLQNMRLSTVMDDLKVEMDGKGSTAGNLRLYLNKRLYVEGVDVRPEDVKITRTGNGYVVKIEYDNRTPFLADIWLLVAFDKQVQIRR